jgi:hypothetical protein
LGRALHRDHSTCVSAVRHAHNLLDAFPELFDRRAAIIAKLQL